MFFCFTCVIQMQNYRKLVLHICHVPLYSIKDFTEEITRTKDLKLKSKSENKSDFKKNPNSNMCEKCVAFHIPNTLCPAFLLSC